MDSGDVVGLWPGELAHPGDVLRLIIGLGSCLHALHTLEHPRWEDWDYTRIDNEQNRFHWLGDGWSDGEKHMRGDRELPFLSTLNSTELTPACRGLVSEERRLSTA